MKCKEHIGKQTSAEGISEGWDLDLIQTARLIAQVSVSHLCCGTITHYYLTKNWDSHLKDLGNTWKLLSRQWNMQRTIHPLLQTISSIIILLSAGPRVGLSIHTARLSFGPRSYFEEIQHKIRRVSQILPAFGLQLSPTEVKWKIKPLRASTPTLLCCLIQSFIYIPSICIESICHPSLPGDVSTKQRFIFFIFLSSLSLNYLSKEWWGGSRTRAPPRTGERGALHQAGCPPRGAATPTCPPQVKNVRLLFCFSPFRFFHRAFWRILVGFRRCACWKAKREHQYQRGLFHFK